MMELISRLRTLRKSAVGILGLPLKKGRLSNFTGCYVGRACSIRYLTGISIGYSIGGEGTLREDYQSMNTGR